MEPRQCSDEQLYDLTIEVQFYYSRYSKFRLRLSVQTMLLLNALHVTVLRVTPDKDFLLLPVTLAPYLPIIVYDRALHCSATSDH